MSWKELEKETQQWIEFQLTIVSDFKQDTFRSGNIVTNVYNVESSFSRCDVIDSDVTDDVIPSRGLPAPDVQPVVSDGDRHVPSSTEEEEGEEGREGEGQQTDGQLDRAIYVVY